MKKLGLTITLTTDKTEELYNSTGLYVNDKEKYNLNICFVINDFIGEKRNSTAWVSNDFLFSDYSDVKGFSNLISISYSFKEFDDLSADDLQEVLLLAYKEYDNIKFSGEPIKDIVDKVKGER
jgi:hypothetical protein|nr:MAG TPA: hypothetical protein [Caudoviricetes sp.]